MKTLSDEYHDGPAEPQDSDRVPPPAVPGLVKPVGEIWSDCNGCPGELLYTFTNPLVIETGGNIGPRSASRYRSVSERDDMRGREPPPGAG